MYYEFVFARLVVSRTRMYLVRRSMKLIFDKSDLFAVFIFL